ncbi:MAG TPA: AAA-like domain-containing protein [Blastocatellia bacterium]|nr:AAA-like domain-containing protein [Blastocatellia bacterium]
MSKRARLVYEFGPYQLDLAECRLSRHGREVTLRPKLFDLLAVLVERSGQMVEKDELITLVWDAHPERADSVGAYESNLTVSVNALRKALGGDHYIETVTKRGYRFAAAVRVVAGDSRTLDSPAAPLDKGPPGGALSLHSRYYIARPTDAEFHGAVARRDSIVLVKGPRQVGKTSLLARGLQQAREAGAAVVLTDLQHLSATALADAERLTRTLAEMIADQLELPTAPHQTWSDYLPPSTNFERYLRREVMTRTPGALVWGVDEADRLFSYPYASEVFGLFRSWHNLRALEPAGPWPRLTLAFAYATEAHLFITDLNQSPFNVGTRLVLEDFTLDEVAELNERFGAPLSDAAEIERFYAMVGGHPYLAQCGLYELATRGLSIAALEAHADHNEGVFGDHLRHLLVSLERDAALRAALRDFLRGQTELTLPHFYRLRSAGVLVGAAPSQARPRCELYARYLSRHLL